MRLYINYQGLNKITCKDCYSISLISNLLDAFKKVKIYTKIDLRNTYYLVCIAESNKWKTAFRTQYGSFKWLFMPFGLLNAPAAFQQFINKVFGNLLNIYMVIYLNNILIYSNNIKDYQGYIKKVLQCLQAYKLYALPTKCAFHKESIEFLEFVLGPKSLTIDKQKIKTI